MYELPNVDSPQYAAIVNKAACWTTVLTTTICCHLVQSTGANHFFPGNTTEGVQEAKNLVSDRLLAHRVSEKVNAGTNSSGVIGSRLADVMARIHVAQPTEVRESFIPEAVLNKKKYDKNDPNRPTLARDVEEANGGAGVFNVDLKADYLLENPEWKHDKIPEIFDGKNIYDYVDPDIEAKLQALEEEEEKLEAEGYYDSDEEIEDVETAEVRRKADQIRTKQALIRNEGRMRRIKNRAALPRNALKRPLSQLEDSLDQLGVDTEDLHLRGRSQAISRGRSVTRSRQGTEDPNAMDIDQTPRERLRSKSRARSQPATNRREDGVVDVLTRTSADKQAKLAQRKMNRNARQGEADRHTTASLAKHLVCPIAPNASPQIPTSFLIWLFSFANFFCATVLWQTIHRQGLPPLNTAESWFHWQCLFRHDKFSSSNRNPVAIEV